NALLLELFDPNRNVDSRYLAYTALTREGVQHSGIVTSETESSVTLLAAEGRRSTLLRADLDELRSTGQSLMPEGLEKELDPQAAADLLAFLAAQQPGGRSQPARLVPTEGQLVLPAWRAKLSGGELVYEGAPHHNLGMWHGQSDRATWEFELEQPGKYTVWVRFACALPDGYNTCRVELADQKLSFAVPGTGAWSESQWKSIGEVTLPAGRHQGVVGPDSRPLRRALLDLQ
ncbi:MAG: dehydrogenase, partial [Planctomycetaceae bacterium]